MRIPKKSRLPYIPFVIIIVSFGVMVLIRFSNEGILQNVPPPHWRGITPSITTMDEVRRILGEPHIKPVCRFTTRDPLQRSIQWIHCFPWSPTFGYLPEDTSASASLASLHQISFSIGGTVKKIVEIKSSEPEEARLNITDVLNSYGKPERSAWSVRNRSYNALLYCEQGIIIHISKTAGVGWIIYFSPMTTERCLIEFQDETFITDPDPNSDFHIEEDPWGFNSKPLN